MAMDHAYRIPVIKDISIIVRFMAYGALWWWMVGQFHKDMGEKGKDMGKMNALMKSGIGLRDFYVHGPVFALKYGYVGVASDEAGEANPCMQNANKSRKIHCHGNRVEDTTLDTTVWRFISTLAAGAYVRKTFYEPNKFHLKDVIIDQQIFSSSVSSDTSTHTAHHRSTKQHATLHDNISKHTIQQSIRGLVMIWQVAHVIHAVLQAEEHALGQCVTFWKDLSVRIGKDGKENPLIVSRVPRELSFYEKKGEITLDAWKKGIIARFKLAKEKGYYRHENDHFIFLEFLKNM